MQAIQPAPTREFAPAPDFAGGVPLAPGQGTDRYLLEGPRSRTSEFVTLLKVLRDFLRGFRVLHFVGPCVTVFGSARTLEGSVHYELARSMGGALARLGFTVMTGGGPGIMEAANRGAKEAGGRSVGCNIELPREQQINVYLDRNVTLHYFFVRKTLLIKYSYAFIVLPGGAGTMDELFEALTLIQTRKIEHFPIVVMGMEYWKELIQFLQKMVRLGTMSREDLELVYATDSVAEAVAHIREHAIDAFGLKPRTRRHARWLGERGLQERNPFHYPVAPADRRDPAATLRRNDVRRAGDGTNTRAKADQRPDIAL